MIETKGRMVTSAGQFFLLLQKITPSTQEVVLQDLSGDTGNFHQSK
jgi:hypothetical protein